MQVPKPVKRSTQLAPLSREHHEGLLLVWKIRQGLKNGTELNLITRYVQWFWEVYLKAHFQSEEDFLLPLLPNEPLMMRMQEEHQEIEALLHINEQIADKDLLEKLAQTIHDHIRFEERELFPFLEKQLTTAQLNEVQQQVEKKEGQPGTWQEEFWLRK